MSTYYNVCMTLCLFSSPLTRFPNQKLAIQKLNLTDVIKFWGLAQNIPLQRKKREAERANGSALNIQLNHNNKGDYQMIGGKLRCITFK